MKKLLFQKELFVRYQSTNFYLQRAVNKYQKLPQRKRRRESLNIKWTYSTCAKSAISKQGVN